MPQRTVFIRNEDVEQWNNTNKAKLVREALAWDRAAPKDKPPKSATATPVKSKPKTPKQPEPELQIQPDKKFSIVVDATGTIVKSGLTMLEADEELMKLNVNDDMEIMEDIE